MDANALGRFIFYQTEHWHLLIDNLKNYAVAACMELSFESTHNLIMLTFAHCSFFVMGCTYSELLLRILPILKNYS